MNATRVKVAIISCGLLVAGTAAANKPGRTYRANRGRIVFQQTPFASFSTEKQFRKIVRKARRNKVLRRGKGGTWVFHFIAFMRRAPKATKVNLVWYRRGKKREQVDYTEFTVPPNEVTLQAKTTLSDAQGFKPGDRLEARVTRLVNGREKIYARCRLKLK